MMTVLGICGGQGVNLFPFLKCEGFKVLGNIEPRRVFMSPCNSQWKVNFPKTPVQWGEDIKITGKVDVIIGAPDCGHSSVLGLSRKKVYGNPKENKSLTFFIKSVQGYQPRVFVMENLHALLKTYGKKDLKEAFKGYHIKLVSDSVKVFGNSQVTRKRLLVIGALKKKDLRVFKLREKPYKLKTSKELAKGLVLGENGHIREPLSTPVTLYGGYKTTARVIRDRWVGELLNKRRWSVEGRRFTSAPGVYRHLATDYPATARKANRQYNQKGLMMSPRELARIQGIPDDFVIHIDTDKLNYWINKGRLVVTKCPPYEIGTWALKCLTKLQ